MHMYFYIYIVLTYLFPSNLCHGYMFLFVFQNQGGRPAFLELLFF